METRNAIVEKIEGFCRGVGLSGSEFGRLAVGDRHFLGRLRRGLCTLRLIERAEAFIAEQQRAERRRRAARLIERESTAAK